MKRYNVFRKEKKGEVIIFIDIVYYVFILFFSILKINDVFWIFWLSLDRFFVNIYRYFVLDI